MLYAIRINGKLEPVVKYDESGFEIVNPLILITPKFFPIETIGEDKFEIKSVDNLQFELSKQILRRNIDNNKYA